jgi:hypothetical protein
LLIWCSTTSRAITPQRVGKPGAGNVAQRDQGEPAGRCGAWHVIEDTMSLAGLSKSDPVVALRRVFVHSSARARAAPSARAKKLDRAREDLQRLERGLGSRHYPTEGRVKARLAVISRERRAGTYLRALSGTDPDTDKPTLTWDFDQDTIDAEAATDVVRPAHQPSSRPGRRRPDPGPLQLKRSSSLPECPSRELPPQDWSAVSEGS